MIHSKNRPTLRHLVQPAGPDRDPALDLARAVAVIAMVIGHTLEALLDLEVRASPGVAAYWRMRGLTAPMFLLVSGWAVALVLDRSGRTGLPLLTSRLPRVGLLFGLGALLRLPTWGIGRLLAGDEGVWRHAIAFDALHCVATGVLFVAATAAAFPDRRHRTWAYLSWTVLIPLVSGVLSEHLSGRTLLLTQTFGGGNAPFPVLPWVAYAGAGAVLGSLRLHRLPPLTRSAGLFVVGGVLSVAAWAHGIDALPYTSPVLVAWRIGNVLLILALMGLVPAAWAVRAVPIGRRSLAVYLIHIPLVYGWGSFPGLSREVGRVLPLGPALLIGLVLLAASIALAIAWDSLRTQLRASKWSPRPRSLDREPG